MWESFAIFSFNKKINSVFVILPFGNFNELLTNVILIIWNDWALIALNHLNDYYYLGTFVLKIDMF